VAVKKPLMRCAMQPGLGHSVAVDSVTACGATGTVVFTKRLLDIAPSSKHTDMRGDLR
jgi:hypothetical protein